MLDNSCVKDAVSIRSLRRLKLASLVAKFVALFVMPERRISSKSYEEVGHSRFLIFAISSGRYMVGKGFLIAMSGC
jgi:hypothetical protein